MQQARLKEQRVTLSDSDLFDYIIKGEAANQPVAVRFHSPLKRAVGCQTDCYMQVPDVMNSVQACANK